MSVYGLLGIMALYFLVLLGIGWITGRKNDESGFYLGNRKTAWYLIGIGMVADSLSGVTFISIPGQVGTSGFNYLQVAIGYIIGYLLIAEFLIPLYFKHGLTSIYGWLDTRFDKTARKTGAMLFLVSRLVGASARLFLAVAIFQHFFLEQIGIPMWLMVCVMILLMLIYTFRGGIKTLIWTDAFQALVMLLALVVTVVLLSWGENLSVGVVLRAEAGGWSGVWFNTNPQSHGFFLKQIAGGALIALTMTGLDQSMMQKSLSCKNVGDAKTNLRWFGFIVLIINFLFLFLGAYLYSYAHMNQITLPEETDKVYPYMAFNVLPPLAMVMFTLGLFAATFSSADSVITTMTTSFCLDFLEMDKKNWPSVNKGRIRGMVMVGFALLVLATILILDALNNRAVIDLVLTLAGYTYGPLLGIFAFGMLNHRKVCGLAFPVSAICGPLLSYVFQHYTKTYLGYEVGYELLGINALVTAGILYAASKPSKKLNENVTFTE